MYNRKPEDDEIRPHVRTDGKRSNCFVTEVTLRLGFFFAVPLRKEQFLSSGCIFSRSSREDSSITQGGETVKTMKAVRVFATDDYSIREEPVPIPGPGEVLVQVEVTGLCRTDLKIIEHGHRDLVLPRIPGEEVVGKIVEIGSGGPPAAYHETAGAAGGNGGTDTKRQIRFGDRVYVYPGTSCGTCPPCRGGAENLCRNMRIMGFHRDGGFAEYVSVPAESLIPVPGGISPETAVFAEPLSCCLNAVELSGLCAGRGREDQRQVSNAASGTEVGIWGAGPAGMLIARVVQGIGGKPLVYDPDPSRLAFAVESGIQEMGEQNTFDAAFVAVGSADAYDYALAALKPRGTLVVFSGLLPGKAERDINFNRIHYLEQRIAGAYGCSFRHGEEALQLIGSGSVKVTDMISHRLPFSKLGEALEIVKQRRGMKVHLYPESVKNRKN